MGVSEQRYIGEGWLAVDQEVGVTELLLHHGQGAMATFLFGQVFLSAWLG